MKKEDRRWNRASLVTAERLRLQRRCKSV